MSTPVNRLFSRRLLVLAIGLVWAAAPALAQRPAGASLESILTDSAIWGPDFAATLAFLQGWDRIGETEVAVFADRMIGASRFETVAAAERETDALDRETVRAEPIRNRVLSAILNLYRARPLTFQAQAVLFPIDGSPRLAWTGSSLQLLTEGLTMEAVQERLGPPTDVTRVVVQTEKDHRPAVLTQMSYAEGTVVFVETDLAPRPGYVDHVALDVAAVVAAFAEEGS